jgi:hypothetical protein
MTEATSEPVSVYPDLMRWLHAQYKATKDPKKQRYLWTLYVDLLLRMGLELDPAVGRENQLSPVIDLLESLFNLDYGVADPPLLPRKLEHRPPHPRWAFFRGNAAAASELLILNGATASAADAWVAKRLSGIGYQKPGKSADRRITAGTIKGWRKEAREGGPGELVRRAFDAMLDDDSPLDRYLPEFSVKYEGLVNNGIEQRPAGLPLDGVLQSLAVIDMMCSNFPPPGAPEK